jgi:small-conductance mechanosensitive channel
MEINTEQAASFLIDTFNLDKIFLFGILFLCIILFNKLLFYWSENLQHKYPSKRLLILQIATIFSFILYIAGSLGLFYMIFKPTKEVMVAVGGSAAVAIGFALKDIVGSIIAGFILLFDRPFQVGDRVQFGGDYGEIKSIGLRSVKLNTLDDNMVTIPNSKFLTDSVASGNSGALDMMVVAVFYLALSENLEKVREILNEVVITSRFVYLEKPVAIVFNEEAVSNTFAVKVQLKAYVLDVKYEKAFLSDLVIRGERALAENNLKRPLGII